MTDKQFKRAEYLRKTIREIEYFLYTADPFKSIQRGSGSWDIDVVFKTKVDKSISILGSRYYGGGSHKQEVDMPNELVPELYELFNKRLESLKEELDNI